jgi:hypothetical protein
MRVFYDTEFIDDGVTIRPISIGMVREDGKQYYAIFNNDDTIRDAAKNPWLRANVLDSLPLAQPIDPDAPYWDTSHPDYPNVKNKPVLAKEVRRFILDDNTTPSLWAFFSAYDHVVLMQLYGRMIDAVLPQRTNDIAQDMERLGKIAPRMPGTQRHNALSDALEVKYRKEWLDDYELKLLNRTV